MAGSRWTSAFFTVTTALLWAALLMGLWVGLTDNTRRWDTIAGLASALVAGATMVLAARAGVTPAVRWRWVLRSAAVPWWIARDTVIVVGALARGVVAREPPHGRMRAVRWDPGATAPLDQGRRALAYGVGSAAPNQYVVGADEAQGVLVVHELEPASSVTAVDLVAGDEDEAAR